MDVALPDLPYVNINFTMPHELLPIFQRNRRLLHDLPALRAAAIQHWARARYGVRVLILVVQQSFGGLLNFHPHLHILVSAGGLRESGSHWIARLRFDKHELMQVWRGRGFRWTTRGRRRNLTAGLVLTRHGNRGTGIACWRVRLGGVARVRRTARILAGRGFRLPPLSTFCFCSGFRMDSEIEMNTGGLKRPGTESRLFLKSYRLSLPHTQITVRGFVHSLCGEIV